MYRSMARCANAPISGVMDCRCPADGRLHVRQRLRQRLHQFPPLPQLPVPCHTPPDSAAGDADRAQQLGRHSVSVRQIRRPSSTVMVTSL